MIVPYAKQLSEGKLSTTPPVTMGCKLCLYYEGALLCIVLSLISPNKDTVWSGMLYI